LVNGSVFGAIAHGDDKPLEHATRIPLAKGMPQSGADRMTPVHGNARAKASKLIHSGQFHAVPDGEGGNDNGFAPNGLGWLASRMPCREKGRE